MAVRQYVGARYVPKFYQNTQNPDSSEWEADQSYEAMTIVTYNNSSFTSKIPVPAGIGNPVQNPTYWVLTGNFNAQVESYRQETQDLREDVSTFQNGLDTEVQNREQSDNEIKNIINIKSDWSKRTVLCVGDSYGDMRITQNGAWPHQLQPLLHIPDSNFHNLCISGNNFSGYLNQITNYTGDRNAVTDIIVAGGLNDSDQSTANDLQTYLRPKMRLFINYARTNYPNAHIWLAYIGGGIDNGTGITETKRTYDKRFLCQWGYQTFGEEFGYTYLNGCEYIMCAASSLYQADGAHPNVYGGERIAEGIFNALTGGSAYPVYPWLLGSKHLYYSVNGGTATFGCSEQTEWVLPDGTSLGNDWVEVTDDIKMYIQFNRPLIIEQTTLINNSNEATYVTCPIDIKFENKSISIRMRKLNSESTGWDTLTPKTDKPLAFFIFPFTASFSTMFI